MYFIQDCLFLICRPSDSIVLANRGNEPKTVERMVMHARHSAQFGEVLHSSGFLRIEDDRNKIRVLPLSMPMHLSVSGKGETGGAACLFLPFKL